MTLKKGILWSQRKMRPQNARIAGKHNPIMQQVLSNKKIAKALDQPRERKEFFGMLKGVSEGGVYKKEMRKLFGDLRSGKVRSRTINAKEVRIISKELFPDSARRYEFSGPRPSENKSQDTLQSSSSKKAGFRTMRSSSKNASYRTTGSNSGSKNATAPTSNPPIAPMKIAVTKNQPAKQYSPGKSLDYEFVKPGFIEATKASSSDLTIGKESAAPLEVTKKKPAKHYPPPGNSLDYEFVKPGFQSEKKLAKKDVEIKPVAPEAYAKIPGTLQKTTETAEETSIASPEATKANPVGNYSPLDDRLKYEYKKPDSSEIKSANSSSKNNSPNTLAKMAPLMNIVRKKMLANKEGEGSGKKRDFFSAIAATTKNKRS